MGHRLRDCRWAENTHHLGFELPFVFDGILFECLDIMMSFDAPGYKHIMLGFERVDGVVGIGDPNGRGWSWRWS